MPARKLNLDDIADLRAYERERAAFRESVIALKKRRRIAVGPIVTVMFENRDTIRFQIQEMARAEKILTDEGIQHELDTYNPLIPEPGQLSATLFIELTSKESLEEWLPKLVGIERSVELVIGEGPGSIVAPCIPEAAHEDQLTRPDVTASVHYIRWELTPDKVAAFATARSVVLAVNHENYMEGVTLSDENRQELVADLQP
ncbi:MAG TPA: DUF3501 family protein [Acidimicrobiales bacterium]|nr:DUF3501 family protein [Acidimicrobiales bacterium]